MSQSDRTTADAASEIRRAVGISLILTGAAAACALVVYAATNGGANRVGLGQGLSTEKVEDWLKRTAQSLQKGCDAVIESIDKRP